jgi:hypothetical protein
MDLRVGGRLRRLSVRFALFLISQLTPCAAIELPNPVELPATGSHAALRILSPTLLEVSAVTAQESNDPFKLDRVVGDNNVVRVPDELRVAVDGHDIPVRAAGFKRRPLYAPLHHRDLRVGNFLYLQLAEPVANNATVTIDDPGGKYWPTNVVFRATADPLRFSPAIHVNEVGYLPGAPKTAIVGYYLGSLEELELAGSPRFELLDVASGKTVFAGNLRARPDHGFPGSAYQRVWDADFGDWRTPGQYRLAVPGLGASLPFRIDDGVAAVFARTYALGLYHQRCGAKNELPFTRFVHEECHTAAAEVPTAHFKTTQELLARASADFAENPRHTAPQLKSTDDSLYPFVRQGKIDVAGGHHDAGDYSKYTLNSANLVHLLVFAADVFPGAGDLDNLGIPESGDGKSDLLQEARWETEFLAKMQDSDGGFYFLVYPREREYETDVLPDRGDPQVVWPKNTAATAAAVAALAQISSSPRFRRQFPDDARRYLTAARRGWEFLMKAIAEHGRDGAYQKITHYGNDYLHDDELVWAACELYLATGEESFHDQLRAWFNPADPATRKWGTWRMHESYGRAIRSYTFAAKAGKIPRGKLDPRFLTRCESEVEDCARDWLRAAQESAYGTSLTENRKRHGDGGWYFSADQAFDLAVATQLDYPSMNDPRPKLLEALLSNLNYEAGCNPVNVCFLTGLGWNRPRDLVDQYGQNDRRLLPRSGLPVGNLQQGLGWMKPYGHELPKLCFPADDAPVPYGFYDRWTDSFNLTGEFVIGNQARGLATWAFLMAGTPLKQQPWKPLKARIVGLPGDTHSGQQVTVHLEVDGRDATEAQVVWETDGHEPSTGTEFNFSVTKGAPHWIEAEALWPDGRRVSAAADF